MMKKTILLTVAGVITLVSLQGCVPLLLGGAATGAAVINDRRTVGTVVDDRTLQLNIIHEINKVKRISENSHINVTVYNGLVLLTGEAANTNIRQSAEYVASKVEGVKKIVNDVVIGPRSSFMNRTYDTNQTAKVKAVMFDVKAPKFNPNRVKVVTEHGVTYLLGIVSEQEAAEIVNVARRVSGVARIVSLFEIHNQIN